MNYELDDGNKATTTDLKNLNTAELRKALQVLLATKPAVKKPASRGQLAKVGVL